ncbi:MAG TPA: DUF4012 domain-containing protein [Nocardioides sp.]|uniref:DUF4012 domain-containing protein n=1 Tax=Nocardioides sp. TaxID=35761 RepID=UPI002E2FE109|nr:DUF4012 domain-containing protein [Nocardioides sp.]HEX3932869.1 DUF4012 domain-containing protein [Nocardioides sp.]
MSPDESTPTDSPEPSQHRAGPGGGRPRGRRRRRGRWLGLAALLLVVVAGVALAVLARPLVSAKHQAQQAQADLISAKGALARHDVPTAKSFVLQAQAHVDRAHHDAHGLGSNVWSAVPVAGTAVDDERTLVDALNQTTTVAAIGLEIYPMVSGDTATLVHGDTIDIATLTKVSDRATELSPHLEAALADLAKVKGSTPVVGGSIRRATTKALDYLQPLQDTYERNVPLLQVLPSLVGADGPRSYLVAMLNPAEERYSGGAALTFTTLRVDHGALSFGTTVNAEDLSTHGAAQSWQPVAGNTFHRTSAPQRITSSTFSPWWSVSGEELLRGYSKAFPGPPLNGLIGIDLQGLASLFAITGPVEVPGAGQVGAGNLVHVLAGSYDLFPSVEARHQVNAALVPLFRQRFLEGGHMSVKVSALVKSAEGRHFFTYFRNHGVERRFANVGLSGDLSSTPYDYVGVFSQNLNGSKVDYWQHRAVTSTVRLAADGSARVHLHVAVTNASPPYSGTEPDPGSGYFTRLLGTRVGVFMPRHATYRSAELDGRPLRAVVHRPKVAGVLNRKYIEGTMSLQRGQTGTLDVDYRATQAAQVVSGDSLVYQLSVDPQDLVTPETLHVHVIWPAGFRPSGPLPSRWSATATGASYSGTVAVQHSWQIPLSKS